LKRNPPSQSYGSVYPPSLGYGGPNYAKEDFANISSLHTCHFVGRGLWRRPILP